MEMKKLKTVAEWLAQRTMSREKLVELSGLDRKVVAAMIAGRYTPSPQQRGAWRMPWAWPQAKSPGAIRRRWSTFTGTGRNSAGARDGGPVMEITRNVSDLCMEHRIDARQLAERAGLEEGRILAILLGRWTPSPSERDKVAAVFGLTREQIAWGHKTPIQHIYGSGPG